MRGLLAKINHRKGICVSNICFIRYRLVHLLSLLQLPCTPQELTLIALVRYHSVAAWNEASMVYLLLTRAQSLHKGGSFAQFGSM